MFVAKGGCVEVFDEQREWNPAEFTQSHRGFKVLLKGFLVEYDIPTLSI